MLLLLQKLLELMQAVQLSLWFILPWQCSLLHCVALKLRRESIYLFLAQMKTIACWALTEPDDGTDASSLRTTASKVEGGWILDGQNRLIGNSTFADLLVIFARNTITNQINGYAIGILGLRTYVHVRRHI